MLFEGIINACKNEFAKIAKDNNMICTKTMIAVNDCISGSTTSLYDLSDIINPTQSYKNNTPFDITSGDYVILQYPYGKVDQGWIQYIK